GPAQLLPGSAASGQADPRRPDRQLSPGRKWLLNAEDAENERRGRREGTKDNRPELRAERSDDLCSGRIGRSAETSTRACWNESRTEVRPAFQNLRSETHRPGKIDRGRAPSITSDSVHWRATGPATRRRPRA